MTEARAQTQRKETMIHDLQDSLTSRLHLMEKTMAAQNEKLEKSFANMLEALRLIGSGASVETIQPSMSSDPAEIVSDLNQTTNQGNHFNYAGVTRLAQFDFPRFNGDKIRDWLFKIEQFFEIDHTPDELKVGLASIHLDDLAAKWHRSLVQSEAGLNVVHDWSAYKVLLQERFNDLLDDPIAELTKLQEIDGIEEYHGRFELLKARVNLPEEYLVRAYLAGLRSDTQIHVRLFHPQSIHQCLLVGRLYEMVHPPKQSPTVWSSSEIINNKETEHHMEEATMGDVQTQQHEDEDNEDAHISVDTVAELSDAAHISVDGETEISIDQKQLIQEAKNHQVSISHLEFSHRSPIDCLDVYEELPSASIARQVFDPLPLKTKLLRNRRRTTFSKTWCFKFKELDVRQEDVLIVLLAFLHMNAIETRYATGKCDEMFEVARDVSKRSMLGLMFGIRESNAGQEQQAVCEQIIMVNVWLYQISLVLQQVMRNKKIKFSKRWWFKYKEVKEGIQRLQILLRYKSRLEVKGKGREVSEELSYLTSREILEDFSHYFLLITAAHQSHLWSVGYRVWHRWKARCFYVGMISTMRAWLFGEGGFDIGHED